MIPRAEVLLAVRFGPEARGGLDVHAVGIRGTVIRKLLCSEQRVVSAPLPLGAAGAVLGVPPSEMSGRVVPLEELWGDATTRVLRDRLAGASDTATAAAVLASAIAERLAMAGGPPARARFVAAAADRLTRDEAKSSVGAVAVDLGMSERNLRRVFRDTVGVGPKTFVKLTRFRRAVRAARAELPASWASIAAAAGYYDQAHLITEFRAIASVTPRALLGELRAAHSIG